MPRGTGTTTKQMVDAPKGALFVWCNGQLAYPKDLARKHGREDLEIVSPDFLSWADRYLGRTFTGVVIDHAANLTDRQADGLRDIYYRVRTMASHATQIVNKT